MRSSSFKKAVVIAIAAVLLRLSLMPVHRCLPERIYTPDSALYVQLARNLLLQGEFVRDESGDALALENPGRREVFRTPGYPVFLMIVQGVFGSRSGWILLFQILLDGFSVFFLFLLAESLFGGWAAVLASALLSIDIGHVVYSNMIMSDILFSFWVTAAFWAILRYARKGGVPFLAAAGCFLSAATAVRPVGLLLFAIAALYLVLKKKSWKTCASFVLMSVLFPLCWMGRNNHYFNTPTLSSAFDFNIYLVAASKVAARVDGISRSRAQDKLTEGIKDRIDASGLEERNKIFRSLGMETFQAHPLATLKEIAYSALEMTLAGERRNVLKIFGSDRGRDDAASVSEGRRDAFHVFQYLGSIGWAESALIILQPILMFVCWIAALMGFCLMWKKGMRAECIFFLLTLVYGLASSLVVASARMRLPYVFIIYLMAGLAYQALWERKKEKAMEKAGSGSGR